MNAQPPAPPSWKPSARSHPAAPRIHIDEAAARTLVALDASSGILTIVED